MTFWDEEAPNVCWLLVPNLTKHKGAKTARELDAANARLKQLLNQVYFLAESFPALRERK